MTFRLSPRLVYLLTSLLIAMASCKAGHPQTTVRFTPGQFWISGFGASPRIPLVGDVDGDGHADILSLNPGGAGEIELARTSNLAKPVFPFQARSKFGGGALIAAGAPFSQQERSEVIALLPDGSLHLAHTYNSELRTYENDTTLLVLPKTLLPTPPLLATTGDFDGDHRTDWLVLDSVGRLFLFQNQTGVDGIPRFAFRPIRGKLAKIRQLASGDLNGSGRATLAFLSETGQLARASLKFTPLEATLSTPVNIASISSDDRVVVGRFTGRKGADILAGQRLFVGGSSAMEIRQQNLPTKREAKNDLSWLAGDLDGDGKDDLIRVYKPDDKSVSDDLMVYFSRPDGKSPWNENQMKDGLLDIWKRGEARLGGLNLKALGCETGRRDVIVEVQRMADVPEETLLREIERAVIYFASLPIENAGRHKGIALHIIYREPIPLSESASPWWKLGEKYHPLSHRGVTHWMLVTNGGGGQSADMADRGSCGVQALYATFLHEFGHQLGLDHTGRWGPVWCPTYPSLMNYAYNYQLEGSMERIGYSDGRLAKVVLNEKKLSERIPIPMEKVAFLAGPPYFYRMKPSEDSQGTLIDWNWNGIFGEEGVSADINYGYSTQAGERHTLGKTYTAPALASVGMGANEKLLLFCGLLAPKTPIPASDEKAKMPSLSPTQPGKLVMRRWLGEKADTDGDRWSPEIELESSGVTGDASACSLLGVVWISYPSSAGVCLRSVRLSVNGEVVIGQKILIPESTGASPTLTAFNGDLALILWRSETSLLGIRLLKIPSKSEPNVEAMPLKIEKERTLPLTSVFPAGATEGQRENSSVEASLWLGVATNQLGRRRSRWQVRSFALRSDRFEQTYSDWIGGEQGTEQGNGRIMLLQERNPALGKPGQLFFFQCGLFDQVPWACHFVGTRIADRSVHGGWQVRRYYDEWTQSRSAPGVCFFQGDIAFALRWFGDVRATENDNCMVGFFGRGIESQPMGDFDDISFIRDVGLSHSIFAVGE